MKFERLLCIHGHFYQPPRENPWLEAVEVQDSAAPYHDWNDRVTAECYGPNGSARISTWDGKILDIRNTYRKISFNFGPTLLQWMELHRPEAYADVLEADRYSVAEREGHGNAIAQAYNHTILPLATDREKWLQVTWGLEDFRRRFGRDPEGMWLPETAVDLKTLDVLAQNGLKYTVMAPRQARRFRLLDSTAGWIDCDGGRIDPTRPYACTLPSGRSIVIFFYDGPISQAVAFEGLLNDGNHFAHRLMQGFSNARGWNQLLSIATDGESYGHHHKHGEMALAYAVHVIEREQWAKLTNYGQYLATTTPRAEVQIWDNSSWSCVHGVERWRSDCGCNSGRHQYWNQKWRSPLRQAYRLLSDRAHDVFDREAPRIFRDPGAALNDYVHVILDRAPETIEAFMRKHSLEDVALTDGTVPLRLLEIIRNSHLIFTSCAWFFDEISGIETVQTLKYAARLIQLLQPWDPSLEKEFLGILQHAPSNLAEYANGADVYRRVVLPEVIDLYRVVAHHAICNVETEEAGIHRLFCYEVRERDGVAMRLGDTHIKISRVYARSLIDGEHIDTAALVMHHGGSDFRCSITGALPSHKFERICDEILDALRHGSITDLIRQIDEHFGRDYYTLSDVFSEGRRELMQRLTLKTFSKFDDAITQIYEDNRKFMDHLLAVGAPLPQGFLSAADFVLKTRLVEELLAFVSNGADPAAMMDVARHMRRYKVHTQDPVLALRFERAMEKVFRQLAVEPTIALCNVSMALLDVMELLAMPLDLREEQNIVFALVHRRPLPGILSRRGPIINEQFASVMGALHILAERLGISVEPIARTLGIDPALRLSAGGSSESVLRMKGR